MHREWSSQTILKKGERDDGGSHHMAKKKDQWGAESDSTHLDRFLRRDALEAGRRAYEEDFGASGKYGKKLFLVESMEKAKKAVHQQTKERKQREAENAAKNYAMSTRNRTDSYYHALEPDVFETHHTTETSRNLSHESNKHLHEENRHRDKSSPRNPNNSSFNQVEMRTSTNRRVSFGANETVHLVSENDMAEFKEFQKMKAASTQ